LESWESVRPSAGAVYAVLAPEDNAAVHNFPRQYVSFCNFSIGDITIEIIETAIVYLFYCIGKSDVFMSVIGK